MLEDSRVTVSLGGVFKQVASVQLQKTYKSMAGWAAQVGQLVPLARGLMVPREGSLSSPVVLLATHVSCSPCSLQMVSPLN